MSSLQLRIRKLVPSSIGAFCHGLAAANDTDLALRPLWHCKHAVLLPSAEEASLRNILTCHMQ